LLRERGFAVVNVTDRADVYVRLVAFESFFSHIVFFYLFNLDFPYRPQAH